TRLGITGSHRKLGHTGGGQSNKAVLARYPEDDVTVAVLLNTERSNARVTATDLEERIERLFFGLPETPTEGVSVPAGDLHRFAGQYGDGFRLVRVAEEGGILKLHPGSRRRPDSPLIPQGGDLFLDEDDPSVQLRFQIRDRAAGGYGRYHNGWFVGLGVRIGTF
ncbi:MAG TPA: hypothetical protein VIK51_12270, partial [Vicinamibacteria bacterium]